MKLTTPLLGLIASTAAAAPIKADAPLKETGPKASKWLTPSANLAIGLVLAEQMIQLPPPKPVEDSILPPKLLATHNNLGSLHTHPPPISDNAPTLKEMLASGSSPGAWNLSSPASSPTAGLGKRSSVLDAGAHPSTDETTLPPGTYLFADLPAELQAQLLAGTPRDLAAYIEQHNNTEIVWDSAIHFGGLILRHQPLPLSAQEEKEKEKGRALSRRDGSSTVGRYYSYDQLHGSMKRVVDAALPADRRMELRAHKDIMVFWNGVPEWEGAMLTPAKRSIEEKALEKDCELELEEQKGAHLAKRFYLWAKYKFQPPEKHDKRAAEMDDGEPVSFRHAEDKEEIMRLKEEQRKEWAKDRFVDKADGGF